jgi:alpha-glucosidase
VRTSTGLYGEPDVDRAGRQEDHPVRWWQEAVVYQIYPRSFADTSGNGVGDLDGIRQRLPYLAWLGVDAIWLSPIYRSPMADFGYDVADHTDIDPLFGDLSDFDRLLTDAHAAGVRVLLDWVPNHTSDQHPWFEESRRSRTSPKRDWYIWRDGRDGGPPNNWRATFADEPAWTYDELTEQWYLHLFLPEQPDLNWSEPGVEAAMHDVLRFWLDRGVDGFRADVIHLIGKDPELADLGPELADQPLPGHHDHPSTHALLRRIRGVLDGYDRDRVMVGEVNLPSVDRTAPYYGLGDELHLVFNFAPIAGRWEADWWREQVAVVLETLAPREAWPTWVLSNHDVPRHRTRLGGSEARARAAAVLLLTLPGTPFLYAGEELGLEDADVPPEHVVDPGGRDGCRAPIPWDRGERHGWPAEPWLPWPPEPVDRSAEVQRADRGSVLWLYRDLLAARRGSRALRRGGWTPLDAGEGLLAYERRDHDDRRVIVVNFTSRPRIAAVGDGMSVQLASDRRGEDEVFDGALPPDRAVLLR